MCTGLASLRPSKQQANVSASTTFFVSEEDLDKWDSPGVYHLTRRVVVNSDLPPAVLMLEHVPAECEAVAEVPLKTETGVSPDW
jgi:hypothetical protein